MNKRIFTSIAGMFVVVLGLTACQTTDLSADPAAQTSESATDEATEEPTVDPNAPQTPGAGLDNTGVLHADGTSDQLPVLDINEAMTVATIATVENPRVPSVVPTTNLLDRSQRYNGRVLSWQELVEFTAGQQWYADGINANAGGSGFNWDDVQKFATINTHGEDRCDVQYNSMVIQAYKKAGLTDDQIRAAAAEWVNATECSTPEGKEKLYTVMANAPIQRIDGGFTNTWNDGSIAQPHMGLFFDTSSMIRVNLAPIVFDEAGNPIGLDGSRGAGIFIDCLNLHWVPVAIWTCADTGTCEIPSCPPGMIGTQPNCESPPVPDKPVTPGTMCPWNPSLPKNDPNCLQPKDWSKTPTEPGWTPLPVGPLTTGQESEQQHESGEVSGNVIDAPVPAGTQSGDTTPDLPVEVPVVAPGATSGGDDRSDDVVDPVVTNQDTGGTNGDTCITDPDTGVSNCG